MRNGGLFSFVPETLSQLLTESVNRVVWVTGESEHGPVFGSGSGESVPTSTVPIIGEMNITPKALVTAVVESRTNVVGVGLESTCGSTWDRVTAGS